MGRQDHLALVTSFDEKKKVISLKHFFNEAFRYNMRCLYPAIVPIAYCLMYMLQCGEYVLSPEFVSTFKKLNYSEAQTYWALLHKPQETSINDIFLLIFSGGGYESKFQSNNRCWNLSTYIHNYY